MARRPATSSEIALAFERLGTGGVSSLKSVDRRLLARALVDEAQKGAFDAAGEAADVARRFVEHGKREFPADGVHMVVRDYRERLRAKALELSTEIPPVTSLILYATAIEHWVNAMIVTASLRAGLSELDALTVVRHFRFPQKLDWLHDRFGLPQFEPGRQTAIQQLIERRNEYVHYKWKGVSHAELAAADQRTTTIVNTAPETLDYLERYEAEHLAKAAIDKAIEIFGVSRADLARRLFRRTV